MNLDGIRIGYAVTGSFCTFAQSFAQAEYLVSLGAQLLPIMSEHAATVSTRFGRADANLARLEEICGRKAILTIEDAEPIGPKNMTDILAVVPCTSNTAAKLALSITDGVVPMAVKSHLRGGKPVVLAVASNDALAGSLKHIGALANMRHYYFVPLRQDAPDTKPTSLVADFSRTAETISAALDGRQIQPSILTKSQ
ncbi:MAG: dipicolinate synthase subunit B [Oscillospiraceae bacterium]|nr:dipicolinate synthase subunit B [Oscillospiraceae bacterium]